MSASGRAAKPHNVSAQTPSCSSILSSERLISLLAQARDLGIPWERILRQEIRAEGTLRAYLPEVKGPWSLREAAWLLPSSLLQSWRVRARIERLAWEAFAEDSRSTRRELLLLSSHLCHRQRQNTPESIRAKHLWLAYGRVLTLMRISRAAEKCRRLGPRSLQSLRAKTGCSREDAEWAVARAGSGRRLNDCMDRAREEGFEIPQAASEFDALALLRKFVKRVFPQKTEPSGSRRAITASYEVTFPPDP
jgi:hypothetical protein